MIYGWETVALSQRQEAEGFILKVVRFSLRVTKTNRLGKNLRLLRRAVWGVNVAKLKKKKRGGLKTDKEGNIKLPLGVFYILFILYPIHETMQKISSD